VIGSLGGDIVKDVTRQFNESLDRCLANAAFLDRFYRLLTSSSEEIAEKFRHTDFDRQKAALKTALFVLLFAHQWNVAGDAYLQGVARRHSRKDLDVRPELYDVWIDCLVQTVAEFDPSFGSQVEDAWRQVVGPGIAFLKTAY
jgi:hemoglobin-like flavoprotein